MSNWEFVEQGIAGLFTIVAVGSYHDPTAPTLRAYSAIVGSHNRIKMVRAAVDGWLHEWANCPCGGNAINALKECEDLATRRNEIAHGIVDRFWDELEKGWFLLPAFYTIKSRPLGGRPAYRYNAWLIDSCSERFLALHNRLNEASSSLGQWHRAAASTRKS